MIARPWCIGSCAAVLLCLLAASCGQVGEPMYPSPEVPMPVTDLVAVERGDQILVTFTLPLRTMDGLLVHDLRAIEVRVGSTATKFPSDQWLNASRSVDVPVPEEPGRVSARISITGITGRQVLVAERTQGRKGHDSPWSNTVTLDVKPAVQAPAAG